jgi:hypothetical protein
MLSLRVDQEKEETISIWHKGEELKIGTFRKAGFNHITHITFDGPLSFEIIRSAAKQKKLPNCSL